jgi:hypothetical protein
MVGFLEELDKTIKFPRNSWHSWRIPGGIDTCSNNIEKPKITQEFLAFLEELTLVQKILRNPNYPGIPGGFLVDSWRN